jgi:hypothetical protein
MSILDLEPKTTDEILADAAPIITAAVDKGFEADFDADTGTVTIKIPMFKVTK